MNIRFFLSVWLVLAAPTALADVTLLRCGLLLDVEEEEVLANHSILVSGGVIEAVGKDVEAPANARTVNLSGNVCMPGLIDAHAHLFIDSTRGTLDQLATTQSSAKNALLGLKNLQTLLKSGFTTVRVPGDIGYAYAGVELKRAIARGDFDGPRMFVAPHPISPTGGHGDLNSYAWDLPHIVSGPLIADGEQEIREAVRREIKYGADWIKVMASGGVMSQHDDPEVTAYTAEEFEAFADEAHRHKKKRAFPKSSG